MKYLILCFLGTTFSLHEIKPKICINCKYLISDYRKDEFAKCSLFSKKELNNDELVNGISKNINKDYYYCSTARGFDNLCGVKGKFYEENTVPKKKVSILKKYFK